jgi:prepilin-type N-terminal cleavage/methylation domain-containing protein
MLKSFVKKSSEKDKEKGFSLVELIIVMLMVSILSVLTLMAFRGDEKFLADSQAYSMLDVLNEAKQRALTQHETIRVEINTTNNKIRIIAENNAGDASDDVEIRSVQLEHPAYVAYSTSPTNIAASPLDSAPIPIIVFKTSTHPLSIGEQVATLRFLQNGNVMDAGSNAVSTNSVMTGATIFVWMPEYSSSGTPLSSGGVIRAISVFGSTGSTKYWRCEVVAGQCTTWKQ